MTVREMLEDLIRKFNAKVASDPALRAELVGLRKTVLIELKDGTKYHFSLADQKVAGLIDGGVDPADITIVTDAETLRGLILREIGPFKARTDDRRRAVARCAEVAGWGSQDIPSGSYPGTPRSPVRHPEIDGSKGR